MEFKINDRVKCISQYEGKDEAVGKCGTVIRLNGENAILVEFDDDIHGHSGNGEGKPNHCWNFSGDLEKYFEMVGDHKDPKYIAVYDETRGDPHMIFYSKESLVSWLKGARENQRVIFSSVRVFEIASERRVTTTVSIK